jgi:secreted trypsin-like serine protease
MKRSAVVLSTLILNLWCTGCQPLTSEPISTSQTAGIIGGTEVQPNDLVFHSTVGLWDEKSGSKCTGSLIAEDIVLTAAHCVNPSSHQLQIVFSNHMIENGKANRAHMRLALSFMRHPQYSPAHSEGTETHDLALVYFQGGLPDSYQAAHLENSLDLATLPQSVLLAAGFGMSNGLLGTGVGTLRQAQLQFLKNHSSTEFETLQNNHGVCSGDSGGPLYHLQFGKLIQIGVASRVATKFLGCRNYAVYTRVDVYRDWIESTIDILRKPQAPR